MLLELVENSEETLVSNEPVHLYCGECFEETDLKITFCGKDETNEPDQLCSPEEECAMCVFELNGYPLNEWDNPVCVRNHDLIWN